MYRLWHLLECVPSYGYPREKDHQEGESGDKGCEWGEWPESRCHEGELTMAIQEVDRVDQIIDKYAGEEGVLIQVLLDIQGEYNWLPKEVLKRTSERLGVPVSYLYRVATYYKAMSLTPVGRHTVNVCLGTACHVRGGPRIIEQAEQLLSIKAGETTPDQRFTLKKVNCLGCCALGPVITVDGESHGKLAVTKVGEILDKYD